MWEENVVVHKGESNHFLFLLLTLLMHKPKISTSLAFLNFSYGH